LKKAVGLTFNVGLGTLVQVIWFRQRPIGLDVVNLRFPL